MAKNPDPTLKLTTTKGVARTLDDWSTMFHLCLVILPPRREASAYIPIADRIFAVFGDADCRTALCVVGNDYDRRERARRRRGQVPDLHRSRRRVRQEPRSHAPAGVRPPASRHHPGGVGRGLGSARVAAGRTTRWRNRWRGPIRRSLGRGIPHRRPAGLFHSRSWAQHPSFGPAGSDSTRLRGFRPYVT